MPAGLDSELSLLNGQVSGGPDFPQDIRAIGFQIMFFILIYLEDYSYQ